MTAALILVDLQNDFLPGGALGVPHGDEVIAAANLLIPEFDLVYATQDWHPANHSSFASMHAGRAPGDTVRVEGRDQILWPDHCVQDTPGAEFACRLNWIDTMRVIRKGTDPEIDSYSGFFDNGHTRSTGLDRALADQGVKRVYVLGLATDYCVRFTVIDALQQGFAAHVVQDGCRGVNLSTGDVESAIHDMIAAGAVMTDSAGVLRRNRECDL